MNELTLCKNIAALRKGAGLTQEALASQLGLTYQAISKWENGLSCPDVQLLPQIADIFNVSIDTLFGRETQPVEPVTLPAEQAEPLAEPAALIKIESNQPVNVSYEQNLPPWEDDDTLYIALYRGHELLNEDALPLNKLNEVPFVYEGPALNIHSILPVHIEGDVMGSVLCGCDVSCENVYRDVTAAGNVDCGTVAGHVNSTGDVDCGSVEGNVFAGGDVDSGGVRGSVYAGGDVDSASVGGSVIAHGDVDCSSVGGSVFAGGDVDAGSVARGCKADCGEIDRVMAQAEEQIRRAQEMAEELVRQAQQSVEETAANLPKTPGTYHYKNGRVRADIVMDNMDSEQIKEKMDGIVNGVEKMLDGFFDKFDFGKKKKGDK